MKTQTKGKNNPAELLTRVCVEAKQAGLLKTVFSGIDADSTIDGHHQIQHDSKPVKRLEYAFSLLLTLYYLILEFII